jgi:peroxiredoxin
MIALLFGTVLPWLLIGVGTWLGSQLVRQNGRILWRLESIDRRLARRAATKRRAPRNAPGGLPLGSPAPDFELPDLTGARRKLSDFRGKNLLLVFFNPQCGFCTRMAGDLAALPPSSKHGGVGGGGEWSVPIIVTTGGADENRKFFEQHGIRCVVLLQEQMQVASQYRAGGTPMGYRIDAAGNIASELAVGAEPLLQLATSVAHPQNQASARSNGSVPHGKHSDPSLAKSKLNRNGLKAGTPAPDFRLPRLEGGELSLATFRGRRVLLVFSDPDCGPCDDLAPHLQELHEERRDVQVLVVSRRDVEATRAKAEKLALTYPIVMQKQWEISLKYAMFATPIGYLIDEQGTIARDVSIGVEPILALADEPAQESDDDESLLAGKEPTWAI